METINLRIEKKGRGGKTVTILEGFTHDLQFLEDIARKIKSACGTGGTVKDRTIEIQGDFRPQIRGILSGEKFNIKG